MSAENLIRLEKFNARLKRDVEQKINARQRFEALAVPMLEWATKWSTQTLARWLNQPHLPLVERDKALVALALQGSTEAGQAIDGYSTACRPDAHKRLYRVVRAEWERRHQALGQQRVA